MAKFFEDERTYPDNRQRANFVFFAYPFDPAIPKDDYAAVLTALEDELGLRLWYFTDEVTTAELMRKIWRAILRCDLAIFDVSGGNPNVAFELGAAVVSNRPCISLLKAGESNPLGLADLAYAERAEYDSAATLKVKLRDLLTAKTTAFRAIRECAYAIYEEGKGKDHAQLREHILEILRIVYRDQRISSKAAREVFGDDWYSQRALNSLRGLDVLQVVGQRRGARWTFSDRWVYRDHEVVGV